RDHGARGWPEGGRMGGIERAAGEDPAARIELQAGRGVRGIARQQDQAGGGGWIHSSWVQRRAHRRTRPALSICRRLFMRIWAPAYSTVLSRANHWLRRPVWS